MKQIYVWNLIEECVRLDREIERLMDKLECQCDYLQQEGTPACAWMAPLPGI